MNTETEILDSCMDCGDGAKTSHHKMMYGRKKSRRRIPTDLQRQWCWDVVEIAR